MARILIDCTHIDFGRQPTGIPRVVLKYIEEGYAWAQLTGNEVVPVVPSSTGLWLCRPVPGEDPPTNLLRLERRSHEYDRSAAMRGDKGLTAPPHLIEPAAGDVLFAPAYWHDNDSRFYLNARSAGMKVVILIHDILPITFKQYYRAPWRYNFAAAVLQTMSYADKLLCVSNTTKMAVEDFARQRGRALPPIEVAHNGFQELVSPAVAKQMRQGRVEPHTNNPVELAALKSDGPLLMVGSIEPKKGHIPVIKTLEAMWGAGYKRNLVIVGRSGWMERDIIDYITDSPFFGTRLFWLNGIDDHDLAYAYVRSHALIFASIAEGFGIPMIEAALLQRPVVVLDTPIAREVLGDHGTYFNEASDLVGQLLLLEDPVTYQDACRRLVDFNWPTWRECVPPVFASLAELTTPSSFLADHA